MRKHRHPELKNEKYVVFVDADRRYTDCSDDVCKLLGYKRWEILNKTIDDLSFDRTSVTPLFEKYVRDGLQDGEYILKHKTGKPVLIKYRSWVFADGCYAAAWSPAEKWEQLYLDTILELELDELMHKISVTLNAIKDRESSLENDSEIHQKLHDAESVLQSLMPRLL
jgi:PAS domain-containing protein